MVGRRNAGREKDWKGAMEGFIFPGCILTDLFHTVHSTYDYFMGYSGDEDKVLMSQSNLRSPLACKQGFSSVTFKRMVRVQATTLTDDF